jgi:hypothetical protein
MPSVAPRARTRRHAEAGHILVYGAKTALSVRFERPMLTSSNMRVINSFEDLTREELERLAAAEETGPELIGRRPSR